MGERALDGGRSKVEVCRNEEDRNNDGAQMVDRYQCRGPTESSFFKPRGYTSDVGQQHVV